MNSASRSIESAPARMNIGHTNALDALRTLIWRELIRYARQPSRVLASLGTSVLIWIFLASGFAQSFSPPVAGVAAATGAAFTNGTSANESYALHLLPGMLALTVVF